MQKICGSAGENAERVGAMTNAAAISRDEKEAVNGVVYKGDKDRIRWVGERWHPEVAQC